MFVCEQCHEAYEGFHLFPVSFGACEVCGTAEACFDCRHYPKGVREPATPRVPGPVLPEGRVTR